MISGEKITYTICESCCSDSASIENYRAIEFNDAFMNRKIVLCEDCVCDLFYRILKNER